MKPGDRVVVVVETYVVPVGARGTLVSAGGGPIPYRVRLDGKAKWTVSFTRDEIERLP